MNVRFLLPAVVVVLLTGCRRDPYTQIYIENMNAEKRLLEDTLYDLQYDYEQKIAEAQRLRERLEELKADGSTPSGGPSDGADRGGANREPRDLFPKIPELQPPTIDSGTGETFPRPNEAGERQGEGDGERTDDGEIDAPTPPELELGSSRSRSAADMPQDQRIARLHIDPVRTRGWEQDREPGDDGITLVFQPQNRNKEFVPLGGSVSVMLLDPDSGARLAQWEFTAPQIEAALRTASNKHGIRLQMPWQDAPPPRHHLQLHVRYWPPTGNPVQADREINISPSGQLASRWTPRTERTSSSANARVDVAENQESTSFEAVGPENPTRQDDNWETSRSQGNPLPSGRQANVPQWRPYR